MSLDGKDIFAASSPLYNQLKTIKNMRNRILPTFKKIGNPYNKKETEELLNTVGVSQMGENIKNGF